MLGFTASQRAGMDPPLCIVGQEHCPSAMLLLGDMPVTATEAKRPTAALSQIDCTYAKSVQSFVAGCLADGNQSDRSTALLINCHSAWSQGRLTIRAHAALDL